MNEGTCTLCDLNYIIERHIWMCESQIYVCYKVGNRFIKYTIVENESH